MTATLCPICEREVSPHYAIGRSAGWTPVVAAYSGAWAFLHQSCARTLDSSECPTLIRLERPPYRWRVLSALSNVLTEPIFSSHTSISTSPGMFSTLATWDE